MSYLKNRPKRLQRYSCPICQVSFGVAKNLRLHFNQHTNHKYLYPLSSKTYNCFEQEHVPENQGNEQDITFASSMTRISDEDFIQSSDIVITKESAKAAVDPSSTASSSGMVFVGLSCDSVEDDTCSDKDGHSGVTYMYGKTVEPQQDGNSCLRDSVEEDTCCDQGGNDGGIEERQQDGDSDVEFIEIASGDPQHCDSDLEVIEVISIEDNDEDNIQEQDVDRFAKDSVACGTGGADILEEDHRSLLTTPSLQTRESQHSDSVDVDIIEMASKIEQMIEQKNDSHNCVTRVPRRLQKEVTKLDHLLLNTILDVSNDRMANGSECKASQTNKKPQDIDSTKRKHIPHDQSALHLQSFKCKYCLQFFYQFNAYSKHMDRHRKRIYRSKSNHARYTQAITTMRSIISHAQHHRYNFKLCHICGKYIYRENWLTHFSDESQKQNHCRYCGKYYAYKHAQRLHEYSHLSVTPYMCRMCGERFAIQKYYKLHMKAHLKVVQGVTYVYHKQTGQKNLESFFRGRLTNIL